MNTATTSKRSTLKGCTIAMSGRFQDIGHSQGTLRYLIESLGGAVSQNVTNRTTHLVCTEYDFEVQTRKVSIAKEKNLHLVSPEWLLNARSQQSKPDEGKYAWSVKKQNNNQITKRTNGWDTPCSTSSPAQTPVGHVKRRKDCVKKVERHSGRTTTGANIEGTRRKMAAGENRMVAVPLDDCCPLVDYVVYVDLESGTIYDASLNMTNSAHNNNKFYRIQVLVDATSKVYKTWTRWGRVGESGQYKILGDGSLDDALRKFDRKFRAKSGLSWSNRGDNPKPDKYAYLELKYNSDGGNHDDVKPATRPMRCTLEKPIRKLMELIFNEQHLQATIKALRYDEKKLPLRDLSRATILRGFEQLKRLDELFDDPSLARIKWNMNYGSAVEHLSNTYYSLIPQNFGRNRPPIISAGHMLGRELDLLGGLSDMRDTAEIMHFRPKTNRDTHPRDHQFRGLGLDAITVLDRDSNEFLLLREYLNKSRGATHNVSYQVRAIFRIERHGEKQRFESMPYSGIKSDRRLLWHGSRCTNFGGILREGLRIAPPEAPASGYMFGKGIYLADMSSKSAQYCNAQVSDGDGLLLLCEVELGDPTQVLNRADIHADSEAKKKGVYSTIGRGKTGPKRWMDAGVVHSNLKGIQMPDMSSKPGPMNVRDSSLLYNEYIVYNVAQVRLRYLLQVRI